MAINQQGPFMPKDEELIVEYLMKKINNQPIPIDGIVVVNFSYHDPDTLSGAYPPLGDNEWYFFAMRNRKYQNGSRPRTTANGFWKATGADTPVTDFNGVTVGSKRSLKFWEGTPSNPIKTDWIMHEYMAAANHQPSRNKRDANGNIKLDDVVLCRIHKKTVKEDKNRGLLSDHGLLVPVPASDVGLSNYLPTSNFSLSDKKHRTSGFDGLPTEEEGPVAQLEGGLSSEFSIAADEAPSEFAADEEFWRTALNGLPTENEEEQQQQYPQKRIRHF